MTGGIRTHDQIITRRVLYHCATTEALHAKLVFKRADIVESCSGLRLTPDYLLGT